MSVKDGKRAVQSAKTKEMAQPWFSLPGAVSCHKTQCVPFLPWV